MMAKNAIAKAIDHMNSPPGSPDVVTILNQDESLSFTVVKTEAGGFVIDATNVNAKAFFNDDWEIEY